MNEAGCSVVEITGAKQTRIRLLTARYPPLFPRPAPNSIRERLCHALNLAVLHAMLFRSSFMVARPSSPRGAADVQGNCGEVAKPSTTTKSQAMRPKQDRNASLNHRIVEAIVLLEAFYRLLDPLACLRSGQRLFRVSLWR